MYLFTSSSCSWSFPSMYLSSYNFAYINTRYNFTHRNTERTMWVSMEVDILTNNIKQMYRIWIWYNSILIRGKRKWSGYGLNRFRFSYSVFWYHFLICPKIRIQCKRKGTVFFFINGLRPTCTIPCRPHPSQLRVHLILKFLAEAQQFQDEYMNLLVLLSKQSC